MNDLDFTQMKEWMPEALQIQMMIDVWANGYQVPREAIIRQIPIAYAWAMSNKKRAPRKNVMRFLNNFMKKAKEFGNLKVPEKIAKFTIEPEPDMSYDEAVEIRKRNMGGK